MSAKPDFVRDVMYRWIGYSALIGAAIGAIPGLLWGFHDAHWGGVPHELPLVLAILLWAFSPLELPFALALLGAFAAYLVTGLLGLVRWLFLGYE
jgi:hypothetical protein